jgi:hypothetical protein
MLRSKELKPQLSVRSKLDLSNSWEYNPNTGREHEGKRSAECAVTEPLGAESIAESADADGVGSPRRRGSALNRSRMLVPVRTTSSEDPTTIPPSFTSMSTNQTIMGPRVVWLPSMRGIIS